MALRRDREYACRATELAGRKCIAVVEQKSRAELVEVLAEQERSRDALATRDRLLCDLYLFVEGVGRACRRPSDSEALGMRFKRYDSDVVAWPDGRDLWRCPLSEGAPEITEGVFALQCLTRAVAPTTESGLPPLKDPPPSAAGPHEPCFNFTST